MTWWVRNRNVLDPWELVDIVCWRFGWCAEHRTFTCNPFTNGCHRTVTVAGRFPWNRARPERYPA